jgi:hypothetical protein
MSFPTSLLKSTWIPNSSLELSICSTACCCCCCIFPASMAGFLCFSFSLLTVSCADLNINLLISSITSSSCSTGWLSSSCNLFCLLPPCKWVDQYDPHVVFLISCGLDLPLCCRLQFCSLFTELLAQLLPLTTLLLPFLLLVYFQLPPAAPWAGILPMSPT